MARYKPYGVNINGTVYGGVTEQNIDSGVEVNSEVTAGASTPQFAEINQIGSAGQFTSHDISSILGAIGAKGLCLEGTDEAGFGIYMLQREDCGTIASGSVHRQTVIPNGLIVPRTLTVQQGQRASLQCEVFGLYDGTNEPILVETSIAAPTGLTDLVGFHLGPVSVGGVSITQLTQVTIDFGIEVQPEYEDGESYPVSLDISKRQPTISIQTSDVTKFGASGIPLTGKACTHANTSIVLRKRLINTGSFVTGENQAEFTAAGIAHVRKVAGASNNGTHDMEIMITSVDDTTNEMLDMDFTYDLNPA
jgi:hypothetical protein